METIEESFAFLLAKADQDVNRRARERLARYRVTPVQYAVLKVLWEQEGASGAELSERLRIDNATLTGIVDRLEAGGLVMRKADRIDRRVLRLHPTPKARSLRRPLDAEMEGLNREIAERLGSRAPALVAALRALRDLNGPGD